MLCQVHIVKYKKLSNHTQLEVKDRETKMAAICQNIFCFKGFFLSEIIIFSAPPQTAFYSIIKKKKSVILISH